MHFVFALAWLLIGTRQQECVHDDACHVGECKVWESSRWVCEPETYAVMVFPSKCILKNEVIPESRLEIRLDANGDLQKGTAIVINSKVEYKKDCGHIEIRKRNVN